MYHFNVELFTWCMDQLRWEEDHVYEIAQTLKERGERKLIKAIGDAQIFIRLWGKINDEFIAKKVNLYEFVKIENGTESASAGFTIDEKE